MNTTAQTAPKTVYITRNNGTFQPWPSYDAAARTGLPVRPAWETDDVGDAPLAMVVGRLGAKWYVLQDAIDARADHV